MGVAIARLRLRGPPERAAMARFAIEDGIRTSWPDDERLVLIRRVVLGRTRPDQRPDRRNAHLRQVWDAATQGRRHGGESGAGDANCVWFASRGEAWRLLLRELIAGRRPVAWFWRLAVPDWQGEPVREWLALALAEALAGRGPIEPVALVEAVAIEGEIDLLFAAVEQGAASSVGQPIRSADPTADEPAAGERGKTGSWNASPPSGAERATIALVLSIRENLPERLVATIERLAMRIGVTAPAARGLLERLALRASPALRLAPQQLAAVVRSYATMLETGRVPSVRTVRRALGRDATEAPPRPSRQPVEPPPIAASIAPGEVAPQIPQVQAADGSLAPALFAPLRPSVLDEAESASAGLWLVVPALIRLGFREWLADHPALAAADGGRRLIRAIGRHVEIDPEDPALLPFTDCAPGDPDFARPWRIALDFHLWRRARIRLRDVVRRQGWLRQADERLVIRFDPESVDLRLRRRALDVDPGWTDWLGLSIRYRYAERGAP